MWQFGREDNSKPKETCQPPPPVSAPSCLAVDRPWSSSRTRAGESAACLFDAEERRRAFGRPRIEALPSVGPPPKRRSFAAPRAPVTQHPTVLPTRTHGGRHMPRAVNRTFQRQQPAGRSSQAANPKLLGEDRDETHWVPRAERTPTPTSFLHACPIAPQCIKNGTSTTTPFPPSYHHIPLLPTMFARQLASRAVPAVRGQSRVAAIRAFSATANARIEYPTVEKGQSLWNFTDEENMLRDTGE